MSMTIRILSAEYHHDVPEILGSLSWDYFSALSDDLLFVSDTKTGRWKVDDFGRGGGPPSAGDNKVLVSMVEVGQCHALQEGDNLTPTRSAE